MLKPDETERAAYLFYGYFHGARIAHRTDWESLIAQFKESEPLDVVHATCEELVRVVRSCTDAELEDLLVGSGGLSPYDPRPGQLTVRDWVEEIVDLLAGHPQQDIAISAARRKAVRIAKAVLNGERDLILAARALASLRFAVGLSDDDPDFVCFVVIDSETDALPIGPERSQWSAHALDRLQPDVERAYRWAAATAEGALQNIVRRFGNAAQPGVAADGLVGREDAPSGARS